MMKFFYRHKLVLATVVVALVSVYACEEEEYVVELGVSSTAVSLTSSAGSTPVMVYSTGSWTLKFDRPATWASLDRTEGYGNNQFKLSYSANYGASRKIGVIVTKGELADTIVFSQAGNVTSPSLIFSKSTVNLLKAPEDVVAGFSTNLRYSLPDITASVTYYDENGFANDPVEVESKFDDDSTTAKTVTPWISNLALTETAVSYSVSENTTGASRTAVITLSLVEGNGIETKAMQTVVQSANTPALSLEEASVSVGGMTQIVTVNTAENNLYSYYVDQIVYNISYSGDSDWIGDLTLTETGLTFTVTSNSTGASRSAVINGSYTDGLGNAVSFTLEVYQKLYPNELNFKDVRDMGSGDLPSDTFIEGFIVSDITSPNVCSSPQTGQFSFDRTENYRTAYIESLDGTYGFRLKYEDSKDNTIERFDKVKIVLDGLTLTKNDDPEYYTISGLTADNLFERAGVDESMVPVKYKAISELEDDDIFTLTSITNLEIMQKDGCYTNASDGYSYKDDVNPTSGSSSSPRWDVAPLLCSDIYGNVIYMLTNAACPWRRDGDDLAFNTVVPQGSGTFRGIIDVDDVVTIRYGDVGRYQIRAMEEGDIDLNNDPFSTTIVEWNWNDRVNDLVPEIGKGTFNTYGVSTSSVSDYNNTNTAGYGGSTSNQKGLVNNGAIDLRQLWWDFDNDEGKYFDVSFSTSGISGTNLVFGIVWGHGSMSSTTIFGASHWKLLYSIDGGETFHEANDGDILKKRSIVWWTTTIQDSCPGYTEILRKLPSDCFGQEEVIVRLQVADKVTDTAPGTSSTTYLNALGIEQGILTSSISESDCQCRIGELTIRYN